MMKQMNRPDPDIQIYLRNPGHPESIPMGTLSPAGADHNGFRTFHYHSDFLKMPLSRYLDPFLTLIKQPAGRFHTHPPFSILTDSLPDQWGQKLYRQAIKFNLLDVDHFQQIIPYSHTNVDFNQHLEEFPYEWALLQTADPLRKGALQFKSSESGPFLNHDTVKAVPRMDYLDVIEAGIKQLEKDEQTAETEHVLKTLLSPAASLGGSRPKCSVLDLKDQLWIAKCPSVDDSFDKGAWEYVTWLLAKQAGINVPDAGLQKGIHHHHIFLSKRFDRDNNDRIHHISADTATKMISRAGDLHFPGYLHIAEFIQYHGSEPQKDLEELWRRLIFNLTISNHDDHLKNHGFLLTGKGWKLAPAFDLNPASVPSRGIRSLWLNPDSGKRDPDSAFEIGQYMQLSGQQMKEISEEVYETLSGWRKKALQLEIKAEEVDAMSRSFMLPDPFQPHSDKPTPATQPPGGRSFFRDLKNKQKNSSE